MGPVIAVSVVKAVGLNEKLKYRFVEKMVENRRITLLFGYDERKRQVDVVKWVEIDEREKLSIAKQGTPSRGAGIGQHAGLKTHQEALAIPVVIDSKLIDLLFVRNVNNGCVEKVILPSEAIGKVFSPLQRAALAAHVRGLNVRRRLENEIGERPSVVDLIALFADKEMSSQTALIGVPEIDSEGSMKIRLMLDDTLNAFLSNSESSPLVQRINGGVVNTRERLELLQNILDFFQPEASSLPNILLRQAIEDMNRNPDSYSDPGAFRGLLHEAGMELRARARRLACQEFRSVLVNTLHEYKPPLQSEIRRYIHQAVEMLETNHGNELAGAAAQRIVHTVSYHLAKLGSVNGKQIEAAFMAPREAPRMPSDCLAHWLTALDDVIADHARHGVDLQTGDIRTLQTQARDYWLAQDLRIGHTREFFATAAEICERNGRDELAAFARMLSSQLPSPDKERFALNATRLHDNPYGRAYDVLLVHSAIRTPHQGILDSVHELGRWLSSVIVPDRNNLTDLDRQCILAVHANVRKKRWHWFGGLPALTAFVNATTAREALITLFNYLDTPKTSGLDCIAIPYLVNRAFVSFPRHLPWLDDCNNHYDTTVKMRRTRLDNIQDAPNEYRKLARQRYAEGNITYSARNRMLDEADDFMDMGSERMTRTRYAGTTLLHHPAAVQEEWMSESVRPINHFKPDFSGLQRSEEHEQGNASADGEVNRMLTRFAQIERSGRFAGDESGVTNIVLFATSVAKREGFRIDADAIWKATAMLTTYNGGHQMEECHTVAKALNRLLQLGMGENGSLAESDEFSYRSLFNRNGGVGIEYWNERTNEAFDELRAYFKKTSVYGDIGVTVPLRTSS